MGLVLEDSILMKILKHFFWGTWLVADGHAFFLAGKVVTIALASRIREHVAVLLLSIEEPADELATAVSRITWVKTTVDWKKYRDREGTDTLGKVLK